MNARSIETSFVERFEVTIVGDTTLMLDLDSGDYFALSATAAIIARVLVAGGSIDAAIDAVAGGIPRAHAERAVSAFLEQLAPRDPEVGAPSALSFSERDGGLAMAVHGTHVAVLARDGTWIEPAATGAPIRERLQWAAPHLLTLGDHLVLHASAVSTRAGVVAFSGASGAGKTTTAHIAAFDGALVSEDLVVLDPSGGEVILEGERGVRAWIDAAAQRFAAGEARIDATALARIVDGPRAPFVELLFLDAERRVPGRAFDVERVDPVAAVGLLLVNAFAEARTRDAWRHVFRSAVAIGTRVPVGCAIVPTGLDALVRALRTWMDARSIDRR